MAMFETVGVLQGVQNPYTVIKSPQQAIAEGIGAAAAPIAQAGQYLENRDLQRSAAEEQRAMNEFNRQNAVAQLQQQESQFGRSLDQTIASTNAQIEQWGAANNLSQQQIDEQKRINTANLHYNYAQLGEASRASKVAEEQNAARVQNELKTGALNRIGLESELARVEGAISGLQKRFGVSRDEAIYLLTTGGGAAGAGGTSGGGGANLYETPYGGYAATSPSNTPTLSVEETMKLNSLSAQQVDALPAYVQSEKALKDALRLGARVTSVTSVYNGVSRIGRNKPMFIPELGFNVDYLYSVDMYNPKDKGFSTVLLFNPSKGQNLPEGVNRREELDSARFNETVRNLYPWLF